MHNLSVYPRSLKANVKHGFHNSYIRKRTMLQDALSFNSLCFKDYFVPSHLHLNGLFVSNSVTRIKQNSLC